MKLAFACSAIVLFLSGGIQPAAGGDGPGTWTVVQSMYHFNAKDDRASVAPAPDSVVRPVYDAFGAIKSRDAAALRTAFAADSQAGLGEFARLWHRRLSSWSINIYEYGEDTGRGWGYAVLRSDRPIDPRPYDAETSTPPFADLLFLTEESGYWRVTHLDLDPELKSRVIAREERAMGHRMKDEEEWHNAIVMRLREAFLEGDPFEPPDPNRENDPNFEEEFQEWLEYQLGIRQRPPVADSFEELMSIHGGRLIDPPISLALTEEPDELSFETPLHGVQMFFYLGTLQELSLVELPYVMRTTWARQSLDDLGVFLASREDFWLPPLPLRLNINRLGRVQLLAFLPVSRDAERYHVFYFRRLSSDALRLPIPESAPSEARRALEIWLERDFFAMGQLILKLENQEWIPVPHIPYVSLMDGGQTLDFMTGPGQEAEFYMETAVEMLEASGLPDHFKHIHTDEECMPIQEAIRLNMFVDD